MGKRKSSSKPQGPKKSDPLPTTFTCLFCNHEKAVAVKMDKKAGVGQLDCKICGQKFQCGINCTTNSTRTTTFPVVYHEPNGRISMTDLARLYADLSAPVDVYSEWVDAADAVAKEDAGSGERSGLPRPGGRSSGAGRGGDDDEDDRRYAGEGIAADEDDDDY
ncbi:Transcription elongation factor Elf1 like [Microdochium nivale]|nr:Transcription elongation factor Elf1 like [Microdochium nivale]